MSEQDTQGDANKLLKGLRRKAPRPMRQPKAPIVDNATSQISLAALQQLRTSCSVRALTKEDLRRAELEAAMEQMQADPLDEENDATVQLDLATLSQGMDALGGALARSGEVSVRQDAMVAAEGPVSSNSTVPVDSDELEHYARSLSEMEAQGLSQRNVTVQEDMTEVLGRMQATLRANQAQGIHDEQHQQMMGAVSALSGHPATTEISPEELLEVLPLEALPASGSNTDALQALLQDAIDRATMDEDEDDADSIPDALYETFKERGGRVQTVPEAFLPPKYANLPPEASSPMPDEIGLADDALMEVEPLLEVDPLPMEAISLAEDPAPTPIAIPRSAPEPMPVDPPAPVMAGSTNPTVAEAPVQAPQVAATAPQANKMRKWLIVFGVLGMFMVMTLAGGVAAWFYFFKG